MVTGDPETPGVTLTGRRRQQQHRGHPVGGHRRAGVHLGHRRRRQYGLAYGAEQAGKGHNVALGPTINILRLPNWGRAPETFSEDPYLTAQQAAAEIRGIQSQHVIATAKHFVANNQEVQRSSINVVASEKARKEIYEPAFKAAVQGGRRRDHVLLQPGRRHVRVRERRRADRHPAGRLALRRHGDVRLGCAAQHRQVGEVRAGPGDARRRRRSQSRPRSTSCSAPTSTSKLKAAVQSGAVTTAELDGMVTHILTAMFRIGLFDHPTPDPRRRRRTPTSAPRQHQALSDRIAEQGTVLLKNADGALPLSTARGAVDRGHRRRGEEPAHRRRRLGRGDPLGSGGHPAGRDHRPRRFGHHGQLRAGHAGHQPAARGPGRRLRAASPRPTTAAPTSPAHRSPRSRSPNLDITGNPAAVGSATTWSARYTGTITAPADRHATGSRCRPAGTSRSSSTTSRSCPSPRCSSPPRTVWST